MVVLRAGVLQCLVASCGFRTDPKLQSVGQLLATVASSPLQTVTGASPACRVSYDDSSGSGREIANQLATPLSLIHI